MTYQPERIQEEVQEIYDVLRKERPSASTVELWTEALTLHAVRYETKILPPPEQQ